MFSLKRFIVSTILLCLTVCLHSQQLRIAGWVYDADTGKPIEFASILLTESGQWAITDNKGEFRIKNIPKGKSTLTVQCMGYKKRSFLMELTKDIDDMRLRLKPENLKLDDVTVVAKRKQDEATTSYTIDRQTLDQQHLLNVSDIAALLPGGRTTNPTLMNDSRMALRSSSQEKGNASFGTAIEIDGMRLDNNAMTNETMGVSTRTLSASNIESIEVVTGIPSVEYGDLSNGIVKVNTRKGKSPFVIEGKLNQHTRQLAVNKGFDLGHNWGVLNTSFEHARSFSDAASPYKAYQRNVLSLHYMNVYMREGMPLTLNAGLTANMGGYNSEADPDELKDDYSKVRDNNVRTHFDLHWLLNKSWLTNLQLRGSLSWADHKSENYSYTSSSSTQPNLHATTQGYYLSEPNETATDQSPIILSHTGYWYVQQYGDSKPLSWSLKLKGEQHAQLNLLGSRIRSRLMLGAEYTGSKNHGRGTYYADIHDAPTWREYRYDQLPTLHNAAFYAEEKLIVPTSRLSSMELTTGVRNDLTLIKGSSYGTVSSWSPRINSRYIFWKNQQKRIINSLELYAGWGKSVKLPSFQVLYPSPSYTDRLAFASTTDATGRSFYAYYTTPSQARYNPNLRWQYTNQVDAGFEMNIRGTRIALSAFYHQTCRSYISTRSYTPISYNYTPPVNSSTIPVSDRRFSIDPTTGIVTMNDASGTVAPTQLPYNERHTYTVGSQYTNATPLSRYGLEWTIDFAQFKPLRTSLRLDGNFYYYKGVDDVLFADIPAGVNTNMSNGQLYQYVGYYRGSNVTGTDSWANASATNGSLQKELNLNATFTTHVPKIRLIIALRLESSLYHYHRALSELSNATRGIILEQSTDFFGRPYNGTGENQIVALYPEYYSTWEQPDVLIPFAEKLQWSKDNDPALFSDLSKLIVRTNYPYTMNPNRLSAYYSANLSITKEIGDHISVSFYANNFFRNMSTIHSSQTDLETSLFASSYIPDFYYGLSLRLKL